MDTPLSPIADALLASYRNDGAVNPADGQHLPSKESIARVVKQLSTLMFPGFVDAEQVTHDDLEWLAHEVLASLRERLVEEIGRVLRFERQCATVEAAVESERLAIQFLESLPRVRSLLLLDVQASYDGDPAATSTAEVILSYPFITAILVQRTAHVLHQMGVPLIPRMMSEWAHSATGIDLHPGAHIGQSFFIDHGTGVVVGETCRIGDRVKLYQGVTLGAKSFKKDDSGRVIKGTKRHPDIEDDVTIYSGATILGGDTVIGARSTVAGNTWLTHSVPADSLVLNEGERVVVQPKGGRSDAFLNYQI
jgi:serine O-acetyltransferase